MIIMLNGAFGAGKTTAANRLVEEIPDSMLFDPEEIGFMLMKMIPEPMRRAKAGTEDFQDLALWRELTGHMAAEVRKQFGKHLIVPMTIRRPDYLQEIRGSFEAIDADTHHFCLSASRETIHNRLRERGEEEGNWCFRQTDKCVSAFEGGGFGEYIDTEQNSAEQVVRHITERVANSLSIS